MDRLQFISLSEPAISIECTILGNCYEAFAMYSFGRYLIACLGTCKVAVVLVEYLWCLSIHVSMSSNPLEFDKFFDDCLATGTQLTNFNV